MSVNKLSGFSLHQKAELHGLLKKVTFPGTVESSVSYWCRQKALEIFFQTLSIFFFTFRSQSRILFSSFLEVIYAVIRTKSIIKRVKTLISINFIAKTFWWKAVIRMKLNNWGKKLCLKGDIISEKVGVYFFFANSS